VGVGTSKDIDWGVRDENPGLVMVLLGVLFVKMKRKYPAKNEPKKTARAKNINSFFRFKKFISFPFSARQLTFVFLSITFGIIIGAGVVYYIRSEPSIPAQQATKESYWLLLHRKSNREFLYKGIPGDENGSALVKTFNVKAGVPGQKPTPLPHLLRRDYWIIIGKMETRDNPETSPYFLTLDVPSSDFEPYGPYPYVECNGQCNWDLQGSFGLHGINNDTKRLSASDPGSSGCVRHSDEDITYLYHLLDPNKEEIRYYIKDI